MSKVYSVSFGIAPNDLLNNKNVSLKAKGLFAYLQSKPDDWDFTIKGIVSQLKESFEAVRKGVRELEEAGYLTRKNYQNDKGQWDCDYYLHVDPVTPNPIKKNPKSEKPNTDKPYTENPYTENHHTKKERMKKERKSKKEEEGEFFIDFWRESESYEEFLLYLQKHGKRKQDIVPQLPVNAFSHWGLNYTETMNLFSL